MLKIGVFDSGIGGITVLMELRKRFRGVHYEYLGDTAHLPYGAKSPAQVEMLSVESARVLKSKKIDALVVACNTASSLALPAIRRVMDPIPVFGMVEPGVEASLKAIESLKTQREIVPILVLATRATIRSHSYSKTFQNAFEQQATLIAKRFPVLEQACPTLATMIEEGWTDHPALHEAIKEYVRPYQSIEPGVALLACTHYPWIHAAFEKALPDWIVVNSAQAIAESLEKSGLFTQSEILQKGTIEWNFTDPEVVSEFAKQFITAQ